MSKQHEIFAVATPVLACRGAGLPAVVFQAPEAGLALQPGLYGAEQSSRQDRACFGTGPGGCSWTWPLTACFSTEFHQSQGLPFMKSENVVPPTSLYLLRTFLAIWSHLWFHINLRTVFTIYVNNAIGILIGITLNL